MVKMLHHRSHPELTLPLIYWDGNLIFELLFLFHLVQLEKHQIPNQIVDCLAWTKKWRKNVIIIQQKLQLLRLTLEIIWLTLELEVDGLISKIHLNLCNSILDFVTSFLQVEHETIEVLLDIFIVSFLLCLLSSASFSVASFEVWKAKAYFRKWLP